MAQGTSSGETRRSSSADDVRRSGAQPEVSDKRVDTTTASPDAVTAANFAAAQPTVDRIAMVARDNNGNAAHSENWEFIVPVDDLPQVEQDAMWNRAGEAMGAKHYDPEKHGYHVTEFSDEERQKRADKEAQELRKINRGE